MGAIQDVGVCVVGGAGFLGSHLVDYLVEERKCRVLVVDNLVVGKREYIHPRAKFAHHDITTSEDHLCRLFLDHEVEWVFNYAAYPYIPDSFDRPLHVLNVNTFGALKAINAGHTAGVRGILQVSSAEIYGDSVNKITETFPVHPHSTYGASKAATDFLVQARFKEAHTPVISLRQFNCIGPRETHPYIVPEILSQLLQVKLGKAENVKLGNNSSRDFLYAKDAVISAVELLEMGEFGQVYNLGSETSVKVYDLVKPLAEFILITKDVPIVQDPQRIRPWEIWHLQSDNTKINKVIRHRPQVSLRTALYETTQWFANNLFKWGWE